MPTARTINSISLPPGRNYLQTVIKVGLGFSNTTAKYEVIQDEIWAGTGRISPTLDLSNMNTGDIEGTWRGYDADNFDYEVVSPFTFGVISPSWAGNNDQNAPVWQGNAEELDETTFKLYAYDPDGFLQDGAANFMLTIYFVPSLSKEYGTLIPTN